jgi:hypothetical protein
MLMSRALCQKRADTISPQARKLADLIEPLTPQSWGSGLVWLGRGPLNSWISFMPPARFERATPGLGMGHVVSRLQRSAAAADSILGCHDT